MTTTDYLTKLLQFLTLIPSVLLCFLPMRHQLRRSISRSALRILAVAVVLAPFCAFWTAYFHLPLSIFILPAIPVVFLFYHSLLKTDWRCSLFVFLSACALMSFASNFAYIFDAWLHPLGSSAQFSWQASLFYCGISAVLLLLTAYPAFCHGSYLVDSLDIPNIWGFFLLVPFLFLLFNIASIPHKYNTLHTNNVFPMYILILIFMLLLMLLIYIMFYQVSVSFIKNASDKERIRFFEMQEAQYIAQKQYIEQTAKIRHDFRQTIITLEKLAEQKNWDALAGYLMDYSQSLPQNYITAWCSNLAVNALLNYYARNAQDNHISLNWKIELPDPFSIPEPDFCALLGNLLENAVAGCMTTEPGSRYHHLAITVQNGINLCIISVNSFDGNSINEKARKRKNRYLSAQKESSGIGIPSIIMTAEKYGGIARFSSTENEFSVEVMMQMP